MPQQFEGREEMKREFDRAAKHEMLTGKPVYFSILDGDDKAIKPKTFDAN